MLMPLEKIQPGTAVFSEYAQLAISFDGCVDCSLNDASEALWKTHFVGTTPEAKFSLTFSLAMHEIFLPILETGGEIAGLSQNLPCGYDYNPGKQADLLGIVVLDKMINRDLTGRNSLLIHLEDFGWRILGPVNQNSRIAFTDPLDGSGGLATGERYQACGLAFFDARGLPKTITIASLTDQQFYHFENGRPYLFNYDASKNKITDLVRYIPPQRHSSKLRIATLPRRMDMLSQTRLFENKSGPDYPTLGGNAALALLSGKVDAMIDPKGQPLYEALIWLTALKTAGLPVVSLDGRPFDYPRIAQWVERGILNPGDRLQYIAAIDKQTVAEVLPLLHEK